MLFNSEALSEFEFYCYSWSFPYFREYIFITEVDAWVNERNKRYRTVDWHFTTVDARVKLNP